MKIDITYYTKEGKSTCADIDCVPLKKLHKLDGPAIEWKNNSEEWWINGKRHRLDGPAVIDKRGKFWYQKGNLHREDGPAIVRHNRDKEWWVNGKKHRSDGPAIIWADGDREWWQNGKLHRIDGPAVDCLFGTKEWYINDKKLNTNEVETWIKDNNINLKTKQHQALFMLRYW